MNKRKFLKTNMVSGVLACCFGLYMAGVTGLSKGIYPLAVFLLIILTGGVLVSCGVRGKPDSLVSRVWWKEVVMVLLLLLHPLIAGTLGFYFTAFLIIGGISWMITPVKTGKALGGVAVYTLLVTGAAFAVFTLGLKIVTPRGFLF